MLNKGYNNNIKKHIKIFKKYIKFFFILMFSDCINCNMNTQDYLCY